MDIDGDLTKVFDAPDQMTAELVFATLRAAGIRAIIQTPHTTAAGCMLPDFYGLATGRTVLVSPGDADAAIAVLAAQEPTEEELVAEMEADGVTLEEAEARVR